MSDLHGWLAGKDPAIRQRIVTALDQEERNEFEWHWGMQAREAQLPPPGDWRIWFIMAGRGFGKTRAGAEWVRQIAEGNPDARIALVSSSLSEARSVMVEGESGLIACSPGDDRKPSFEASLRRVSFPNGAQAQLFSAADPESLRGPQFSHAFRAGTERILREPRSFNARFTDANGGQRVQTNPANCRRRRRMLSNYRHCDG